MDCNRCDDRGCGPPARRWTWHPSAARPALLAGLFATVISLTVSTVRFLPWATPARLSAAACPPPGSLGDLSWRPTQHTTATLVGAIVAGPSGDPKGMRASPPGDVGSYDPKECSVYPTGGTWPN